MSPEQTGALLLFALLAVHNLIAFFLMRADKRQAQNGMRRIPERTLLLLALFLGGPGIWLGMYAFRHKTKHLSFRILAPLFTVAEYGALFALIVYRSLV